MIIEEDAVSYEYYVTSELESSAMRRPTLTVRRATHVYLRRRIVVASVFFSLLAALGVGAGNVLANRGGAPASASAVRQATTPRQITTPRQLTTPGQITTYLVQPGDTMYSIAEEFRAGADLMPFVDDLIELNGGVKLQVGQLVTLP